MNLNFSLDNFLEETYIYSKLKNKVWIVLNWIDSEKTSLIFKTRKEVLLAKKGQFDKMSWEFAGKNIFLINRTDGNFLFRIELLDESICVLRIDEDAPYIFFVNETLYDQGVKSTDSVLNHIENQYAGSTNTSEYKVDPVKKIINENFLAEQQKLTRYRNQDLMILYTLILVAVIVLILIIA